MFNQHVFVNGLGMTDWRHDMSRMSRGIGFGMSTGAACSIFQPTAINHVTRNILLPKHENHGKKQWKTCSNVQTPSRFYGLCFFNAQRSHPNRRLWERPGNLVEMTRWPAPHPSFRYWWKSVHKQIRGRIFFMELVMMIYMDLFHIHKNLWMTLKLNESPAHSIGNNRLKCIRWLGQKTWEGPHSRRFMTSSFGLEIHLSKG